MIDSFVLFAFVEFNGGSAEAAVMSLVVLHACFDIFFFGLFLFPFPYFPSPPAICRHLLFFVWFRPCKSYLFLFITYVVLLAAF